METAGKNSICWNTNQFGIMNLPNIFFAEESIPLCRYVNGRAYTIRCLDSQLNCDFLTFTFTFRSENYTIRLAVSYLKLLRYFVRVYVFFFKFLQCFQNEALKEQQLKCINLTYSCRHILQLMFMYGIEVSTNTYQTERRQRQIKPG